MRTLQELKSVKFGEMTKEEQRLCIDAAVGRLKTELESPAVQKAMTDILNAPKPKAAR